jgi:hypothetical protein
VQKLYEGRMKPERLAAWKAAYDHNLDRFGVAYQIKQLEIREYEATRQAISRRGASTPNFQQRIAALRDGKVAPAALPAQTKKISHSESVTAWAAVVSAALPEAELNAEEWGGYLASAWYAELHFFILPEDTDADDLVFYSVLEKLELPAEYWPVILRYVRVNIQGGDPSLWPIHPIHDTTVAPEPPDHVEAWTTLFIQNRVRRELTQPVNDELAVTPEEAKTKDDAWLLERLQRCTDEGTAKRIIRAIRK